MPNTHHEVTRLLSKAQSGDRSALDRLLPLAYAQLRAVAARQLRYETARDTMKPMAIVNEAYLLLIEPSAQGWQSRVHFIGIAAHLVRKILVDHANRRAASRRSARLAQPALKEEGCRIGELGFDMIRLDEALNALSHKDARLARMVELHHFGGLGLPAMAEVLGVEATSIEHEWRAARAWIHRYLSATGRVSTNRSRPGRNERCAARL